MFYAPKSESIIPALCSLLCDPCSVGTTLEKWYKNALRGGTLSNKNEDIKQIDFGGQNT